MSIDMPLALEGQVSDLATDAPPQPDSRTEASLTALFTVIAVLLASFVAVVTAIV
jgi:hypothetical protein